MSRADSGRRYHGRSELISVQQQKRAQFRRPFSFPLVFSCVENDLQFSVPLWPTLARKIPFIAPRAL